MWEIKFNGLLKLNIDNLKLASKETQIRQSSKIQTT